MKFINTRPEPFNHALSEGLMRLGYTVLEWPCIKIIPTDLHDFETADRMLLKSDDIVLTSPNAFRYGEFCLKRIWDRRKPAVRLFAMGSVTANLLIRAGFSPVYYPPPENFATEGLVGLDELSQIDGHFFTIMGAAGGRELLKDTLVSRGANVEFLNVYERKCPEEFFDLTLIGNGDVVIISSIEALVNFLSKIPKEGLSAKDRLKLLVSSPRIADKAYAEGFSKSQLMIAMNATDTAIIDYVSRKLA